MGPPSSRVSLECCRLWDVSCLPFLSPAHTHAAKDSSLPGLWRLGASPAHPQLSLGPCTLKALGGSPLGQGSAFLGFAPAPHSQGGLWTSLVSARLRGGQCWAEPVTPGEESAEGEAVALE